MLINPVIYTLHNTFLQNILSSVSFDILLAVVENTIMYELQ